MDTINLDETVEKIARVLTLARTAYMLVQWPDSQKYMEEEWFKEEAYLAFGYEDEFGSAAYFIPLKRVLNATSN